MKIKKIEVRNLFGFFDHSLPLQTQDRITIIHGPNGVGKTTILKMVYDLFRLRFGTFLSTKYDSFEISFDDSTKLRIKRKVTEDQTSCLEIKLLEGRSIKKDYTLNSENWEIRKDYSNLPLEAIDEIVPNLTRYAKLRWRDMSTGEMLTLQEVIYRYGDQLPTVFRKPVNLPTWLEALLKNNLVHFIQTQRLINVQRNLENRRYQGDRPFTQTTVEKYANSLSMQIQETLEKSGVVATSLDRTFPLRLLEKSVPIQATEKSIRKRYQNQSEFRDRLMNTGLIDAEEQVALPRGRIQESDRKVLWYYLDDVEKKLVVFDDLLEKAELLLDIINSRFSYKKLTLDKNEGFQFFTNNSERVPLTSLSSGEQHELVLAYELLFEVKKNALILIDEPELSLHVTWQHKFLDDLERISRLADLDFLVATHSPSIVGKRRDLMVSLGEGKND